LSFSELGLAPAILGAVAAEGYRIPTPIQTQAIPPVLAGRDLCGIAQTGTGKTAAFALPILHRLAAEAVRPMRKGCRALVLSPTRELASQIADAFRTYGRSLNLTVTTVFGGVPIGRQQRQLAGGTDILVATPGRLLDLVEQRSLVLSGTGIFILDEADRMLDLGFIHALKRIAALLPLRRQTLLFSATMPTAIGALAASFLRDPVRVTVTPAATTVERVDQRVIFVTQARKQALLAAMLNDAAVGRALVFSRTKRGADKVVRALDGAGVEAAAIHGNKSQGQRERALRSFRDGHCRVLVATDIAARGIDIDGVTHVINLDLPDVAEQYVHRIGRTARAGATGVAFSFCSAEDRANLTAIERLTRSRLTVQPTPEGFAMPAEREVLEPTRVRPAKPQLSRRPAAARAFRAARPQHPRRAAG
jgi:ATP-dependent RNA helicase RhlE